MKISIPSGGFQFDLTRNVGVSLKFYVGSLRKNHLHRIFPANSIKSALRSISFILVDMGAKPKPFSKTGISVSIKIFLLRLNTDLKEN